MVKYGITSLLALVIVWFVMYFNAITVYCQENKDYYSILGVRRNANEKEIKKAYKKLSIKWHPDRNLDNAEAAKNMFVDISNAYDTLIDPNKRREYDRGGIKAVQDYEQQQGQAHLRRDIFGRIIHEPDPSEVYEDFFSGTDVQQLTIDSMHTFYRRNQVWVLFFYKSNQQDSKNVKGEFIELVNKMFGIFGTAAIDCAREEELCDEFVVFNTPSIIVFTENINDQGLKYTDKFDHKKIINFASQAMQSFISIVTDENYESFISRDTQIEKALIFSDKKYPNALLKSLSKLYKGKIIFGFVRNTETELIKKFKINKFTTLMVLTDPENYIGDVYTGDSKLESLKNFFRAYAYYKDPVQKVKPITELTENDYNSGICKTRGKAFCLIMFTKAIPNPEEVKETLNKLGELYQKDPISFYFVDSSKENEFESSFNNSNIILYRFQKLRYARYTKDEYSYDSIKAFIDDILSGNNSGFQKNSNKLQNLFQRKKIYKIINNL